MVTIKHTVLASNYITMIRGHHAALQEWSVNLTHFVRFEFLKPKILRLEGHAACHCATHAYHPRQRLIFILITISGVWLSGIRGTTILTAKWLQTAKEQYTNEHGTHSDVSLSYFLLPFCTKSLLTWTPSSICLSLAFLTKIITFKDFVHQPSVLQAISFNFELQSELESMPYLLKVYSPMEQATFPPHCNNSFIVHARIHKLIKWSSLRDLVL